MDNTAQDSAFQDNTAQIISSANTVLVILTPNPTYDQMASACSLYLGLLQTGKDAHFVIPELPNSTSPKKQYSHIAGVDHLKTEMGNQNLVIGFDYNENTVDKVNYHIGEKTGKFYLTIKPKKGFSPLDTSSVDFSYTGIDADLVFTIGVGELKVLEHLYHGFESLYTDTTVISVHSFATDYASVKIDVSTSLCMASAMYRYLNSWGLPVNADSATNLLSSIEKKTNSFSSMSMTADVFADISELMRAGARRVRV